MSAGGEIWLPVPGFSGYEASDLGSVRSWRVNAKKAPLTLRGFMSRGYRAVRMYADSGALVGTGVHRAVLLAHRGLPPPGMVAAHLDNNRLNNSLNNLVWATRTENEAHKLIHGTRLLGERHHQAKVTQDQVNKIRERRRAGETLFALADDYGVHYSNIGYICSRTTWRHVP